MCLNTQITHSMLIIHLDIRQNRVCSEKNDFDFNFFSCLGSIYPLNPQTQSDLDRFNYGQTIRGSVRIPYPSNPSAFNRSPYNPNSVDPISTNYNPIPTRYNPINDNGINFNSDNERNYDPNRLGSIFQSYPTSPFYGSNNGLRQVDSTSNRFGQDQFYNDQASGRRNPQDPTLF